MGLLRNIADNRQPGSLAAGYRRRRCELFRELLRRLPRALHILDVGGTEQFWLSVGLEGEPGLTITLLNLEAGPAQRPGSRSVAGDARDLTAYPDASVDIVFSNSTVHVERCCGLAKSFVLHHGW